MVQGAFTAGDQKTRWWATHSVMLVLDIGHGNDHLVSISPVPPARLWAVWIRRRARKRGATRRFITRKQMPKAKMEMPFCLQIHINRSKPSIGILSATADRP